MKIVFYKINCYACFIILQRDDNNKIENKMQLAGMRLQRGVKQRTGADRIINQDVIDKYSETIKDNEQ